MPYLLKVLVGWRLASKMTRYRALLGLPDETGQSVGLGVDTGARALSPPLQSSHFGRRDDTSGDERMVRHLQADEHEEIRVREAKDFEFAKSLSALDDNSSGDEVGTEESGYDVGTGVDFPAVPRLPGAAKTPKTSKTPKRRPGKGAVKSRVQSLESLAHENRFAVLDADNAGVTARANSQGGADRKMTVEEQKEDAAEVAAVAAGAEADTECALADAEVKRLVQRGRQLRTTNLHAGNEWKRMKVMLVKRAKKHTETKRVRTRRSVTHSMWRRWSLTVWTQRQERLRLRWSRSRKHSPWRRWRLRSLQDR